MQIFIPSKVSKICQSAFSYCQNLIKIEIQPNSNLQTIESYTFLHSNIKEIFIPSKVSKICTYKFDHCQNLAKIEFPTDSNLQTIESHSFEFSNIKEIYFPSSLKKLKEGWCSHVNLLTKISISPSNGQFFIKDDKYLLGKTDPNIDEFGNFLFAYRDIKEISIPTNIKIISSHAFEDCKKLTKVEIPLNSNLQIIKKVHFHTQILKKILIPSKVFEINSDAFSRCRYLTKVEIPANSNLQKIESDAFEFVNINGIFIPSKATNISTDAFYKCNNSSEISEETKIESFSFSFFYHLPNLIIMIPSSLKI